MAKKIIKRTKDGETVYFGTHTDAVLSEVRGGKESLTATLSAIITLLASYYTKSETYSQAEVNQLVSAIKQFHVVVAASLPTASASTMNTIYLIPSSHSEQGNVKDEFITIQDGGSHMWEQIGTTAIDLSGYSTTAEMNAAIASALSAYSTTSAMNAAIAAAVESEEDRAKASVGYYVCDTAAGTAAKAVSAAGYTLAVGGNMRIKMTNANTADNVTLNINATGAKPLSVNTWNAGEVLTVYYDGTQYVAAGGASDSKVEMVVAQALSVHQEKLDELQAGIDELNETRMGEDEAYVISMALNELNGKVGEDGGEEELTSAVSGELTISNSEKISVLGSSFGTGSFNLAGKNWAAKLSLFSDYQFENLSTDGFNYTELLDYLRKGMLTFNGRYALLCDNENSNMALNDQLRALQNIATWLKTYGAEPVIATSYRDYLFRSALLKQYADENNLMFWDAVNYCSQIAGARNTSWDGAAHLATRNSQMVTDAYMPHMVRMERPRKSIKVFRMRDSVDYTYLDDVMFMDNEKRAELFKELYIGTQCNSTPSSVDDISHCTLGGLSNEYRTLAGAGMLFSRPVLISAVLPVNASDLTALSLTLNSTNSIKVFTMDRKKMPYPQPRSVARFSVSAQIEVPATGAVYTTGGKSYTVEAVVMGENGYYCTIYCSPALSATVGAGTLTKVSGTGASTISYAIGENATLSEIETVLLDAVGHWVELQATGNSYLLDASQVKNCVEIDKIHFLVIPQETDTFLSNISIKYAGNAMKPATTRRYYDFLDGRSLDSSEVLSEPTFGAVGTTQTVWKDDNGGSVVSVADYEQKYPLGCSSVVDVDDENAINQNMGILPFGRYVLEVISRYFPPIYTDGSGNQITLDSYDYETLEVSMAGASSSISRSVLKDRVGTYWKISQFEFDVFTQESLSIRVGAGKKGIEICKVSLKKR